MEVQIKIRFGEDTRKAALLVNADFQFAFEQLCETAGKIFPISSPAKWSYIDNEGDKITFSSDSELQEAYRMYQAESKVLKVSVETTDSSECACDCSNSSLCPSNQMNNGINKQELAQLLTNLIMKGMPQGNYGVDVPSICYVSFTSVVTNPTQPPQPPSGGNIAIGNFTVSGSTSLATLCRPFNIINGPARRRVESGLTIGYVELFTCGTSPNIFSRFELQPGEYIIRGSSCGYRTGYHTCRLAQIDPAQPRDTLTPNYIEIKRGTAEFSDKWAISSVNYGVQNRTFLSVYLKITAASTYEFQHCSTVSSGVTNSGGNQTSTNWQSERTWAELEINVIRDV